MKLKYLKSLCALFFGLSTVVCMASGDLVGYLIALIGMALSLQWLCMG
jgi:hypothetical protein